MKIGDNVTWYYEPSGGYGFIIPVDGKILNLGKKKVTILVQKKSGEYVTRLVNYNKIKLK